MEILGNYKRLSLAASIFYALFGYIAAAISNGMKAANGPIVAACFIISIVVLDVFLIKRRYRLSHVNVVNMSSIFPFYFFSITMPLFKTCPSALSPIIAFAVFSFVTFLPFAVIAFLIRRVLIRNAV